jgi:leucyl-tRNA synthetase
MINEKAESYEEFIRQIARDVEEIQEFTKIKPKKASIFIADSWKFDVLDAVLKNKEKPPNEVISELMKTDIKKYGSAVAIFVQSLYKRVNELYAVERDEQLKILEEAKAFLEKDLNFRIEIIDAEKSSHPKARSATPMKPGILLE